MPARIRQSLEARHTRKYLRWLLAAAVTVAMFVAVLTTVAGTGFAQPSASSAEYQYATGCPNDKAVSPINVSEVSPPAHLLINRQAIAPSPVRSGTQTIVFRFHVSACGGRSIIGALVYQTPTPYQQFSANEVATGPTGWATITAHRLRHFPASSRQQLLVVFVRARKPGEDLLGGISARRLVSFKVNLHS
jgi:hypothetical protein